LRIERQRTAANGRGLICGWLSSVASSAFNTPIAYRGPIALPSPALRNCLRFLADAFLKGSNTLLFLQLSIKSYIVGAAGALSPCMRRQSFCVLDNLKP